MHTAAPSAYLQVGLCESCFLLLEYSIEYLIEYSSTRWIPEVAINHRVVQNKRIPGSSFNFVI